MGWRKKCGKSSPSSLSGGKSDWGKTSFNS